MSRARSAAKRVSTYEESDSDDDVYESDVDMKQEESDGEFVEAVDSKAPRKRGRASAASTVEMLARTAAALKAEGSEESDEEAATPVKRRVAAGRTRASPKATKAAASPVKKAAAAKATAAKKAPARGRTTASRIKKEEGESEAEGEGVSAGGEEGEDAAAAAAATLRKRGKGLKPMELMELAMKANKWWEEPVLEQGIKWVHMEHCGVLFPPTYQPHGVKMKYDDKDVDLTLEQEEMATFYAQVAPDGPQLGNPKTAKVFNKNFWNEFKKVLGPNHIIKEFTKCDFSPIRAHLKALSEAKKALPKEEKERLKEERNAIALRYGFALVDGHLQRVGNYMVEPPGLFRGRGEHPKMGVLKRRIMPEEITINVAHSAAVPPCPLPGRNWKRVVHDPSVTWLAFWKDPIAEQPKYVFLAASSSFKGRSDLAKYEKARLLVHHIDRIRSHYEKLLHSKEDVYELQSGTAMWIIDHLALRVGGEKDEDEADTVGCCSLRVEHLHFPDVEEGGKKVTFDFLGKDSMRYYNTVDLTRWGAVGARVHANLVKLCRKKKPDEDVFDQLTPDRLNEQLNALLPGLSAKVFRTYNASVTLENELKDLDPSLQVAEKSLEYNRANREVAILCNHQRTVPKSFQATFEKLESRQKLLQSQVEELKEMEKLLSGKGKKDVSDKIKLKTDEATLEAEAERITKQELSDLKKQADALPQGPDAPLPPKIPEYEDHKKVVMRRLKEVESHRFARLPELKSVQNQIVKFEERLEKLELDMRNRDENKAVALGTSKINYMDPRITVAWCKKVELPIERVFPKTLRDKFPWAMGAMSTFKF